MADTTLIAFATMARNDDLFLRIWINYYASFVPKSHLFIVLDGHDQKPIPEAEGCNIITMPRGVVGPGWEQRRWNFLIDLNKMLQHKFDVVVFNDCDEIIAVDPNAGIPLLTALAAAKELEVISPFGVEIIHRPSIEPDAFDPTRSVLEQRCCVRVNSNYSKPRITSKPLKWTLGGHRSDHPTLNLSECLYLFHLRFFDRGILHARQNMRLKIMENTVKGDEAVAGGGWTASHKNLNHHLAAFEAGGPPQESDFVFDWQRRKTKKRWELDADDGCWRLNNFTNHKTYLIPERFKGIF